MNEHVDDGTLTPKKTLSQKAAIGILIFAIIIWTVVLFRLVTFGLPSDERIATVLGGQESTIAQRTAIDQQRDSFFGTVEAQREQLVKQLQYKFWQGGAKPRTQIQAWELYTKVGNYDNPVVDDAIRTALLRNAVTWGLYSDESLTLSALSRIRPSKLDFHPRTFVYGGAFLYPVGITIFGLDWLGAITVHKRVSDYLENPGDMAALYIVARGLPAVGFLAMIWLTFSIARLMGGYGTAAFAVLALSGASGVWGFAFIAKPHAWAAAWGMAAIYALLRADSSHGRQRMWLLVAGISGGMAMGSALGHSMIGLAAPLLFWRGSFIATVRPVFLVWIVMALTWGVTNPYILLEFGDFLWDFYDAGAGRTSVEILHIVRYIHELSRSLGPVTSLAAIGGAAFIAGFGNGKQQRFFSLIVLSIFVGGMVFKDLRLTLYVVPLLCIVVGLALTAAYRAVPTDGKVLFTTLAGMLLALQFVAVVGPGMAALTATEGQSVEFRKWVRDELPPSASIGFDTFPIPTDFMPPLFGKELYDIRSKTLEKIGPNHPARNADYIFLYDNHENVEQWAKRYDHILAAQPVSAPDWMLKFFGSTSIPWKLSINIWRRRE